MHPWSVRPRDLAEPDKRFVVQVAGPVPLTIGDWSLWQQALVSTWNEAGFPAVRADEVGVGMIWYDHYGPGNQNLWRVYRLVRRRLVFAGILHQRTELYSIGARIVRLWSQKIDPYVEICLEVE